MSRKAKLKRRHFANNYQGTEDIKRCDWCMKLRLIEHGYIIPKCEIISRDYFVCLKCNAALNIV